MALKLKARSSRTAKANHVAAARPAVKAPIKSAAAAAALGISPLLLQVQPARAEAEAVDTAVDTVVSAVKVTGQVVKSGIDLVSTGVKVLKDGYDVAAPVVKQGLDVVSPVVQSAVKATAEVAGPALKAASPVLQGAIQDAGKALESSGITSAAVTQTTAVVGKTASETSAAVTPILSKVADVLTHSEPVALAEYGLGAVALYYLAPALLGLAAGSLRGYAGEVTAASCLDALASDSSTVLIDIRSAREKEASGVPDVPSSGSQRLVEVEFAFTEDKKLRSQLKDVTSIEATVTALQIANLKRLSKGSTLLLLDKNGGQAKAVAKALCARGFNKVFIVAGGFEGRGGWVQSKLQIKPVIGSFSSSGNGLIGTIARTTSTRKALPAPKA